MLTKFSERNSPAPQTKILESDLMGSIFSNPRTMHENGSQSTPIDIGISSGSG